MAKTLRDSSPNDLLEPKSLILKQLSEAKTAAAACRGADLVWRGVPAASPCVAPRAASARAQRCCGRSSGPERCGGPARRWQGTPRWSSSQQPVHDVTNRACRKGRGQPVEPREERLACGEVQARVRVGLRLQHGRRLLERRAGRRGQHTRRQRAQNRIRRRAHPGRLLVARAVVAHGTCRDGRSAEP